MIDRTLSPTIQPISDFILSKPQKHRLDNGVNLYTINAGEQSILQLQFLFNAGKSYEPRKGVSAFTAKMLLEGTTSMTTSKISNAFDSIGAFKEISAGFEYTTFELYFLDRFLGNICDILTSLFTEANFPQKELESVKSISRQQLAVNQQKNSYVSGITFRKEFFGEDSPYGYQLTEDIISSIDRQQLVDFYHNQYQGAPFEIILAGKIERIHLETLNNTLGQLLIKKEIKNINKYTAENYQPNQLYLEKEEALQTSIKIGKPLPALQHPDRVAIEVLNEILGGYFGSRLMKNIREEKGLTYGIYSTIVNLLPGSYIVIGAEVQKEKRALALQEIYKEIEKLQTDLVSQEELALVTYYMSSSYMRSINTPIAISEYFKTIHFHHLPEGFFDTYVSKIQKVTAQEIQKAAQEYLKLPMLEVTVG